MALRLRPCRPCSAQACGSCTPSPRSPAPPGSRLPRAVTTATSAERAKRTSSRVWRRVRALALPAATAAGVYGATRGLWSRESATCVHSGLGPPIRAHARGRHKWAVQAAGGDRAGDTRTGGAGSRWRRGRGVRRRDAPSSSCRSLAGCEEPTPSPYLNLPWRHVTLAHTYISQPHTSTCHGVRSVPRRLTIRHHSSHSHTFRPEGCSDCYHIRTKHQVPVETGCLFQDICRSAAIVLRVQ